MAITPICIIMSNDCDNKTPYVTTLSLSHIYFGRDDKNNIVAVLL